MSADRVTEFFNKEGLKIRVSRVYECIDKGSERLLEPLCNYGICALSFLAGINNVPLESYTAIIVPLSIMKGLIVYESFRSS